MNAKHVFALGAVLFVACTSPAQSVVRPGEQRLNRFQYHATHNSYERDQCAGGISITEQLDRYDVWMLEFDLRWKTTGSFDDFWILHDCAEPCNQGPFDDFLAEIVASHRATHGLTVIYFDSGDISSCSSWPNIVAKPTNWQRLLETKLTNALGSRFYTYADFANDNRRLPSPQELLRRGKNFIPIVNTRFGTFFFDLNSSDHLVKYNTGDETEPLSVTDLEDRYVARHYPSGGWLCSNGDQGWEWAVTNNYTFPASNCSDKSGSPLYANLHPPLPMYLKTSAPAGGRGSWREQVGGVFALQWALTRVATHENLKGPSTIDIQIAGGGLQVLTGGRVASSVRLAVQGGEAPVRIARNFGP